MKKINVIILVMICTILGMKANRVRAEEVFTDKGRTVIIDTEINSMEALEAKYGDFLNISTGIYGRETWESITSRYNYIILVQLVYPSWKGDLIGLNVPENSEIRFEEVNERYGITSPVIYGKALQIGYNKRLNESGDVTYGTFNYFNEGCKYIILKAPDDLSIYMDGRQIHGFDPERYEGLGNFIYQDLNSFGQYDPDENTGEPLKEYILECDYPVGKRFNVEWYMYIPKKETWDLFQEWYNEGIMWDMIERLTIPTQELEKTSDGKTVYWYPIEQGMENYFNSFSWCRYVYNMPVVQHYDVSRNDDDYNVDGSRKRNAFVFEWDETMLEIFVQENIDIGINLEDYDIQVGYAMLYYSFPRSAKVLETGQERTYNRKTSAYEWEKILEETTAELPEGWYDPSINQYYIDAYRTTDESFKNEMDDNTWFIVESWHSIPGPLRDLIIVMLCAGIIAGFIKLVM